MVLVQKLWIDVLEFRKSNLIEKAILSNCNDQSNFNIGENERNRS